MFIEPPTPPETWQIAWRATGLHLQKQFRRFFAEDDPKGFCWLRTDYAYPSFDDLMFAYRNQVFSVRFLLIERRHGNAKFRAERDLQVRNSGEFCARKLQLEEAQKYNDIVPCLFPIFADNFEPAVPDGWNLFHARTLAPLSPETMATDELIPKSDFEINNLIIQFARDHVLPKMNAKLMSFCEIPGFDPQMWFVKDGSPCWMLIQHSHKKNSGIPHDVEATVERLLKTQTRNYPTRRCPGYFLGVRILDVDRFTETLYRGAGPFVFDAAPKPLYTPYDPYKPKIDPEDDFETDADAGQP